MATNDDEAVSMLVRVFGMIDADARKLLRSAGGTVDFAIDAWLEAGQQIIQRSLPGEPIMWSERLRIAQRWAWKRR